MGIVIFNGVSSQDYGIQVEHPPGYSTPERDYDQTHVPGRNGDVFIDKGSYKNVNRTYEIAIGDLKKSFSDLSNNISEWLHSTTGYARLEDSYEPEYYRMAVYHEELNITNILFHAGRATINFDCKPQRFLKAGERAVTFNKKSYLLNPTNQLASPIIMVYGNGSGTFLMGDYGCSISEINGSIVINSEIQDCYSGTVNRNSDVTLNKGFPKLTSGQNEISFSGGITKMEVVPKWWTL